MPAYNLYGGGSPGDFEQKFERPYKALLDAGVRFYASLGNHDNPNERCYKPFNMGGERYYNFTKGNVGFFALDGNYMDPQQLSWLEQRLHSADSAWKLCFFHQPLYSNGKFHGPDVDLRARLEPLFVKYGVDVVFSGHEHFYERFKPQHGVYYFILGNSGELHSHAPDYFAYGPNGGFRYSDPAEGQLRRGGHAADFHAQYQWMAPRCASSYQQGTGKTR